MYSVEWNKDFENIDLYADISQVTAQDILEKFGHPDVIWASPDCTTFSIAAISHHRRKNPETGNLDPISDYAKFCDATDQHVVSLIKELNPTYYFIENPRGGMRKMTWMQDLPRYTVTYCKYGDTRMKPTDIWTNHPKPKFLASFTSSFRLQSQNMYLLIPFQATFYYSLLQQVSVSHYLHTDQTQCRLHCYYQKLTL